MYKWILPSLSEVLAANQVNMAAGSSARAERQWRLSIAATEKLLLNTLVTTSPHTNDNQNKGLILAAPAPVFSQLKPIHNLETITFTAKPFNPLALMPFEMPTVVEKLETSPSEAVLPLLAADPLGKEQFCLIFTSKFQLVLVLAEDENGAKVFSFSFEPEVVQQAWKVLGARVMLVNPDEFVHLTELVQKYIIPAIAPDFRIVMQFSQLLLAQLPEEDDNFVKGQEEKDNNEAFHNSLPPTYCQEQQSLSPNLPCSSHRSDVELLQAFAHEVRTPLATIRTVTKLLLKQKDLPANVIKRLEIIDRECTEQIDRMELLFRAAELETSTSTNTQGTQLAPMCLEQILQQSIPRWQQAASRRNLTLDVVLPQKLPTVVSNPNLLDRVLTNLIENFTRSLPAGSRIQVHVIPAGNQLKLQLLPQLSDEDTANAVSCTPPIRKAIGQLLMFQPETGTISLNLAATKHLFQAIGGKLIVRQRPQQGEVMTIFLPLNSVDDSGIAVGMECFKGTI
ncbi:sensor histidine kinase [Brunnivagina elsteri]|uniref:histidine kinase n=1 Tax=Brunnivagina elsteri CCALA 953 TaxID=987040 RepID=A0A2A2TJC4_9CYAN|nr:HAMP domain-containing sensor histidine kinase [Calothrix elsteri]PAX54897.1 histidine kinase [Calothrix elsteri CCALA 953]